MTMKRVRTYFLYFTKKHPKRSSDDAALLFTEVCPAFLSLSECVGNALYNLAGWTSLKKRINVTYMRNVCGDASNFNPAW